MGKILEGLKVVELANYVAAPTAGRILADWGAEVVKIENLEGDTWRHYFATSVTPWDVNENPVWEIYNINKKCISLNLREAEGKEVLMKLLEDADVFITSNRPKALCAAGLDYDSIKERFPKLIYAMITGYGQKGPDCDAPGFDTVAFWARSGLMGDAVPKGGYPLNPPGATGDAMTGVALFGGICGALVERNKTGKGDLVETSLYGTAVWALAMMGTVTQECYGNMYPKTRDTGSPLITSYMSRDGEWFTLTIVDYDRYFRAVCAAMDAEEIADDPRFDCYKNVMANREQTFKVLEDLFKTFDYSEIEKRLQKVGVTFQRLHHYSEMHKDPQALANDFMRVHTFDSGRSFMTAMPPIRLQNMGQTETKRAGRLGENTFEVLKTLGYSDQKLEELRNRKVIGQL